MASGRVSKVKGKVLDIPTAPTIGTATAGGGSASTSTVVSTITICNQASSAATYRIAVRPAAATLAAQHYIVYGATVAASDTTTLTLGLTLATTDVVTVYASSATVSFNAYGSEIA